MAIYVRKRWIAIFGTIWTALVSVLAPIAQDYLHSKGIVISEEVIK